MNYLTIKVLRFSFLFIILVFSVFTLNAQELINFRGRVVDKTSNQPLPYAHVGIPEKGIGTTTGGDGSFLLKVPLEYTNSTFEVSYLGYKSYRKNVKKLTFPLVIKMEAVASDLIEVIVMDERTLEDIIRRATRQIPDNYPSHPTNVLGFYRESRTNADNEYMYLAEGVLNIYKTSYKKQDEGDVSLVQGRQVALTPPEELSQMSGFSSGHLAGHRFDFVKNREDFIDEKYFPAYKYWLHGMTRHDDRPVYVIAFEGEEGKKDGRMKGKVYIDTLSYAYVRAEFEILPKGLRKIDDYPLYAGNWKGNSYVSNYQRMGDKWYFSNAIREGLYRDGGVYSNEIMVTEQKTKKGKPLPYLDRLDRGRQFLSLTGEYDEDFWKGYNTTPMSEGLAESVRQYQNNLKAAEVFDSTFMANLQRKRDSIRQAQEAALSEVQEDLIRQEITNRFPLKAQFGLGLQSHLISTDPGQMSITYLTEADSEVILFVNEEVEKRDFEALLSTHLNVFFSKHFFFRWDVSIDFWNSIYKHNAQGFGAQFNLSKQRPFFIRAALQHTKLKYARKIGQAKNEFGDFKADGKTFKADNISLYYGSRTHNLKASVDLAIELNPAMELYVRGSYLMPFAEQQHVYFWERKEIFRKKARVPLNSELLVERNDAPFRESILKDHSIMVSVGLIFK